MADISVDMVITDPIVRMSRDIRASAVTLSDVEARFLVDAYYTMQAQRIRSEGQMRELTGSGEPHSVLQYLAAQSRLLEEQVRGALGRYVAVHPVGSWMVNEVKGIGPVIAAGLLAHIDITRAPTAGHIISYAGLRPDAVWHSAEFIRGLVSAARKGGDDWSALLAACAELKRKPLAVLQSADVIADLPSVEDAAKAAAAVTGIKAKPKAQISPDNVLHELVPKEKLPEAYKALTGVKKWAWKEVIRVLTKRPWNAELKKLTAYLLGEAFVKTSGGDEPGYYGTLYKKFKEREIERNERGDYAKRAAAELEKKNYRADTVAKKHYEAGTLPPAHIHRRAVRLAVERFIIDLHTVWYWIHYKRLPPLPYVIEHGGHAHYEVPASFEAVPGLMAALKARSPVVVV